MGFKIYQYDDNFRIGVKGKVCRGVRLITNYFRDGKFVAVSIIIDTDCYKLTQIEQSEKKPVFNVGPFFKQEDIEVA